MKIKQFINDNPDWLDKLERDYRIHVTRDGNLVSLKYNQLESPMHEPIVQECRGMVVNTATGKILAHPYNKFWNHGEPLAATIDWSTARVLEKLDGSLMILYWDGIEWQVASSGTPTASGGFGMAGAFETFRDAFWRIWQALEMKLPNGLDHTCFMFELCATENRVVVRHERPRIVLHGARNLETGDELNHRYLADAAAEFNWELVKSYPITNIDETLAAAEALDPMQNEGFVVVDAWFNRVKIKSPRYVVIHHIKGEGMSLGRAVDLWVSGETQELLTHFPEFEPDIMPIHERLDRAAENAVADVLRHRELPSRKEFAMAVKDAPWSSVTFKLYEKPDPTAELAREIMRSQSKASLERLASEGRRN